MDQRKNKSSRHPENNKARKMDVGGSRGKTNRRNMDYSCDRVDTTHWENKSGQTVQEMERRNRQVLGDACLDRTYKGQKRLEKHAEAFILQWNDSRYDDDDDDDRLFLTYHSKHY